jgi:sarcosine oxidase, subunit beta
MKSIRSDVVVIGGGVIGCSISYFLSRLGISVTLVEAQKIGETGATANSGGILRVYDPDLSLAHLAMTGLSIFRNWKELGLPGDSGYTATGLLYLFSPTSTSIVKENLSQICNDSYPIELIPADEILHRFPQLKSSDWGGAIFEPKGGYGDCVRTAKSLAYGAKEKGALLIEGSSVNEITVALDQSYLVKTTSNYNLAANIVVLATGAYTPKLFSAIDISAKTIPAPYLENSSYSVAYPIIDENNTYVRPLTNNQFLCGSQKYEIIDDLTQLGLLQEEEIKDVRQRISSLLASEIPFSYVGGVKGIDGYTPNNKPLIGFGNKHPNLYFAVGFSGRGYKLSLAVGLGVAQQILSRIEKTVIDELPKVNLNEFSLNDFTQ